MPKVTYVEGPSAFVQVTDAKGNKHRLLKAIETELPKTTIDSMIKGVSDDHKFKVGKSEKSGGVELEEGPDEATLAEAMAAAKQGGGSPDDQDREVS